MLASAKNSATAAKVSSAWSSLAERTRAAATAAKAKVTASGVAAKSAGAAAFVTNAGASWFSLGSNYGVAYSRESQISEDSEKSDPRPKSGGRGLYHGVDTPECHVDDDVNVQNEGASFMAFAMHQAECRRESPSK